MDKRGKIGHLIRTGVPLLVASVVSAVLLLFMIAASASFYYGFFNARFWLALYGAVLSHVIFLGVPVYLVLYMGRWIRWWSCAVAGFFIGMLPSFIIILSAWNAYSEALLNYTIFGGVPGMVGGLTAWAVWKFLNR